MEAKDTENHQNKNSSLIHQLNELLADVIALSLKAKNYHWNLEGLAFIPWHVWLDEATTRLHEEADSLAERIRMQGATPKGSMESLRSHNRFLEGSLNREESLVIAQLKQDYQLLIYAVENALDSATAHKDYGTTDMLTVALRVFQKDLWYLKASSPENTNHN